MPTMKKTTAALLGLSCLLLGTILGFLISPMKNGIKLTFHHNHHPDPTAWYDEEDWEDYDGEPLSDEDMEDMPF